MLPTAFGFPKAKVSPTITPFWQRRPQIFPQVYYNHELNESTEQMAKLSFISL